MFSEKAPFGIPTLSNKEIKAEIKKVITTKSFIITPEEYNRILNHLTSPIESFRVITAMLMLIDEYATYSLPVFKTLAIFMNGLHQNRFQFVYAAKVFIPEIRSLMLLSFNVANDMYRDQIHYMIQAIYNFLMYKAPLPTVEACTVAPKMEKPPQVDEQQEPEIQLNIKFEENKEEESDDELPSDFQPAVHERSINQTFNPFGNQAELISFEHKPPQQDLLDVTNQAPSENISNMLDSIKVDEEPTVEQEPPKIEEGLNNPRDIYLVTDLQLELSPQYDDKIESW